MTSIKNNDVIKQIEHESKLNDYVDKIPKEIFEKLIMTLNVNPDQNRVHNIVKSASAAGTMYTTPVTDEFYLKSIAISVVASGAAAAGFAVVNFTSADGTANFVAAPAAVVQPTLGDGVQGQGSISVVFDGRGILCKANTTITLALDTNMDGRAMITGYTVDPRIYEIQKDPQGQQ